MPKAKKKTTTARTTSTTPSEQVLFTRLTPSNYKALKGIASRNKTTIKNTVNWLISQNKKTSIPTMTK